METFYNKHLDFLKIMRYVVSFHFAAASFNFTHSFMHPCQIIFTIKKLPQYKRFSGYVSISFPENLLFCDSF